MQHKLTRQFSARQKIKMQQKKNNQEKDFYKGLSEQELEM